MKNGVSNRVIVIGYNTFNCYGVVRSLGEAGIKPDMILAESRVPFIAKSRYVNSVKYFKKPSDLPEMLLNEYTVEDSKPIVICCDDPIQSAVDCNYGRLKEHFLLSNCDDKEEEITRLMDKDVQVEYARKVGLDIPETWHIPQGAGIPADIIYPCIAKPYRSISGTKSDIRICKKEEELYEVAGTKDYTVQQFIEKDYEVILWGTSVGEGKYYIPGVTRKIRQYPLEWSLSSYGALESFDMHPGLEMDRVYAFLQSLNYTGMFSIEMAVRDGKYYFLEINLRNDGKQHFSTVAGANLPLMYIKSLLHEKVVQPHVKRPTFYMGELSDFRNIFKRKISFFTYIKDLFKTDSFFIFNFKDPYPFIYQQIKRIF